jgi:hypothetical protein
MLYRFDILLALNVTPRQEFISRTMCVGTILPPQVILQVNKVTSYMTDIGSSNNTQVYATFVAVFIPYRVQYI